MYVKSILRVIIALTLTSASYTEAKEEINAEELSQTLELLQRQADLKLALEEVSDQLDTMTVVDEETNERACDSDAREDFIIASSVIGALALTAPVALSRKIPLIKDEKKADLGSNTSGEQNIKNLSKHSKRIKLLQKIKFGSYVVAATGLGSSYIVDNSEIIMKCPEAIKLEAEARKNLKSLSNSININSYSDFTSTRG